MKPVKMPANWYSQFVGIQLHTGARFKISRVSVTMELIQLADYVIDLADGYVIKSRGCDAGTVDLHMQRRAIDWMILHDDKPYVTGTYRRVYPTEGGPTAYQVLSSTN